MSLLTATVIVTVIVSMPVALWFVFGNTITRVAKLDRWDEE